ncbi:ImmA/IrrE family metallo-endopeptidase [Sphingomonas koreensis]|uniref:ImmA/IrrE family metallo-endopeptidase n=1 Tax=Sphingomonas koreensis TaxID=93064 RepID=UPI0009FCB3C3|nr:ImmA/IrrE family metallo-endopeptidase [Sphingomonas koreensis]RSU62824.1 ImmA/IrrE family metallo-endopeptidase [Sphingomonas koreensis]RSU71535.1 ImmA/IrrE family metallo-endopeptidase [Sphingomonas koreensis]
MTIYEPAEASLLTKGAVHKLAESIATQVGWEPGSDIHSVISNLGGCVEIEDTLLTDPGQTGSLYVDGPQKFRIIVPSHTSPERDRFTIAHEFGHFVLHYLWQRQRNPSYPEKVVAFRHGSKRIEWEANWFAGAFLMPADLFRHAYEAKNGDLWQIADQFRVSSKAAEVRAKDLGLLPNG